MSEWKATGLAVQTHKMSKLEGISEMILFKFFPLKKLENLKSGYVGIFLRSHKQPVGGLGSEAGEWFRQAGSSIPSSATAGGMGAAQSRDGAKLGGTGAGPGTASALRCSVGRWPRVRVQPSS